MLLIPELYSMPEETSIAFVSVKLIALLILYISRPPDKIHGLNLLSHFLLL